MPHKDPEARRAYLKKRYANDAEVRRKCKERSTKWARENAGRMTELQKTWRRKQGQEYYRSKIRPKLYKNIRPETQNCESCGTPFDVRRKEPHADHDHATGNFRGWLCANCNIALGNAKDSRDRLQLLINYLDRAEMFS